MENNKEMIFIGVLTTVFIALKLTGVIDWSWIWVLSPLWAWLPIILSAIAISLIVVCIEYIFKELKRKIKKIKGGR